MTSKRLSTVAVKQQRRGTSVAQKASVIGDIAAIYPTVKQQYPTAAGDNSRRLSWIERVRNRKVVLSSKGQHVFENHFPSEYRGIFSLRFAPDGDKCVTAYGVGAIQVWHAESGKHCITVRTPPDHGDAITSIRFLPNAEDDDMYFVAGTAGTIYLCSTNAGDYREFAREPTNEINALDVDAQGDTVVTAGKDATLRLYDIYTKKMVSEFGGGGEYHTENLSKFHRMRVFAVRFHPDHKEIFMSGGWDDCVKIWDARVNSGYVKQFRGPHICGDGLDIHGNQILTGSWKVDKSLQLWDFMSGKLISNITPINRPQTIDGEFLYCCQFFAGDFSGKTVVCGGSGLSAVEVIDVSENRIISRFKNQKATQAIDTTTKFVAYGGMESVMKVITVA